MTRPDLYQAIQSFDIDGGPVPYPFVKKLAKENGWSASRAQQVLAEYRRFVYLAMVCDHPVSPSDAVDQAWHLHMLYTESYWSRMTAEILPRPLHHGPSKGGAKETKKFDDWYARTVDSYRREFGAEPPTTVWPPVGKQFAETHHFQRVNRKENLVIPIAKVKRVAVIGGLAASMGLLAVGCVNTFPFAQSGFDPIFGFMICGGAVFMVAIIVAVIRASMGGRSGGGTGHHTDHNMMNSGFHSTGTPHGYGHGDTHGVHSGDSTSSAESIGSAAGDVAGSFASDAGSSDSGGSSGCGSSDGGGSGCGGGCGGGGD